jgi:hypothetical protein
MIGQHLKTWAVSRHALFKQEKAQESLCTGANMHVHARGEEKRRTFASIEKEAAGTHE